MNTTTNYSLFISIFATLTLMFSCSQELTYQEALDKNQNRIDDAQKIKDAKFLVEAKSFNMLEMQLDKLATESGYASRIVKFSNENLKDHETLKEDLDKLARQEDIKLPTEMNQDHQEMLEKVSNADRGDFDKEYIRTLKRANEENKNKYLDMATEAYDADVRAFSARNLDMLRSHSEEIKQIQDKLLNTY